MGLREGTRGTRPSRDARGRERLTLTGRRRSSPQHADLGGRAGSRAPGEQVRRTKRIRAGQLAPSTAPPAHALQPTLPPPRRLLPPAGEKGTEIEVGARRVLFRHLEMRTRPPKHGGEWGTGREGTRGGHLSPRVASAAGRQAGGLGTKAGAQRPHCTRSPRLTGRPRAGRKAPGGHNLSKGHDSRGVVLRPRGKGGPAWGGSPASQMPQPLSLVCASVLVCVCVCACGGRGQQSAGPVSVHCGVGGAEELDSDQSQCLWRGGAGWGASARGALFCTFTLRGGGGERLPLSHSSIVTNITAPVTTTSRGLPADDNDTLGAEWGGGGRPPAPALAGRRRRAAVR